MGSTNDLIGGGSHAAPPPRTCRMVWLEDGVLTMALLVLILVLRTMALLTWRYLLWHTCRSRFRMVYSWPKERTCIVSTAAVSTATVSTTAVSAATQ